MIQHPSSLVEERWSRVQVNDRHIALAKLGGRVGCVHCPDPTFHEGEEIFARHSREIVYANIDYWFDWDDSYSHDRPTQALLPDGQLFRSLRSRFRSSCRTPPRSGDGE
jgi:hypothetical protein